MCLRQRGYLSEGVQFKKGKFSIRFNPSSTGSSRPHKKVAGQVMGHVGIYDDSSGFLVVHIPSKKAQARFKSMESAKLFAAYLFGISPKKQSDPDKVQKYLNRYKSDAQLYGAYLQRGDGSLSFEDWKKGQRQEVLRKRQVILDKYKSADIPIKIGYDTLNIFQRYWDGQNDPLYALLSRRGNSPDWVTVKVSKEELERLIDQAQDILHQGDKTEKRVAKATLQRLKKAGHKIR